MTAGSSGGRASITLFLCGDVMTGRGIDQVLPNPGDPRICEPYVTSARDYVALAEERHGPLPLPLGFAEIWGEALPELTLAMPDLRIVNLETAVTRSEDCGDKGISYRMSPENLPCLTAAGIDCCVLANNHVLDWGRAGLIETLESLDQAGIKRAGAGRDDLEAGAPAILPVPEKGRVLVFAFGHGSSGVAPDWAATKARPGVNLLPDLSDASIEAVSLSVKANKGPGDLVVVSLHWGPNWGYGIPAAQRAFAKGLIEGGVDVVHGHSAHHVKGIEVYRQRPIFYGCGDFFDDYEGITGYEDYRDDLVLMYFVTLAAESGALLACRMTPLQIRRFRLNRVSERDARWMCDLLSREGAPLGTGAELGEDGRLSLTWR
ncbi:MAG: CapA family protein [Kiloniellales bacterium]|nr:CapA family protein [Kiloniellales bacterium]